MEISNKNTIPQVSQDVGRQVHNTALHASKAHDIADKIVAKHDRHSFKSDRGREVINTAAGSMDHGVHDGTDEKSAVEEGVYGNSYSDNE